MGSPRASVVVAGRGCCSYVATAGSSLPAPVSRAQVGLDHMGAGSALGGSPSGKMQNAMVANCAFSSALLCTALETLWRTTVSCGAVKPSCACGSEQEQDNRGGLAKQMVPISRWHHEIGSHMATTILEALYFYLCPQIPH